MAPVFKGIILLGGEGERFGGSPKQFRLLGDKPIYLHTLERFLEAGFFHEIILVMHPSYLDLGLSYPGVRIVAGGRTRQHSSLLGLKACGPDTDFVIIHDGVRPFVSKEILQRNKEAVLQHLAVDTCIPSYDTIVSSKDREVIDHIPPRATCLRGQTPQSFSYNLILQAHTASTDSSATDDCQLVLALGKNVHIVMGSEENSKITTPWDLAQAELFLQGAFPP